jgi:hypothetical protein
MSRDFMKMSEQQEFDEIIASPRKFIEEFLWITTKDGKFIKFKLNFPQKKLMKMIEDKLAAGEPIRIRILKARQMGFSTLISGIGFWWSGMNENSSYAVVAHKDSSAVAIFSKNKIFYDNLPPAIKPQTNKFNSEKISFNTPAGDGLKSSIFFGTAGGGELFRGETILFVHKSEVAFWEDKTGILKKSINACVPLSPFSCIIEETTANGYNEFKDGWDRSIKGLDDYQTLFVGWNEMVEYAIDTPPGFELTDKELTLQMDYDLTDEQLNWRRYKIANDFDGDLMWFMQEYPLTPEEAFIASGLGVFDSETIKAGYAQAGEPIKKINLESIICREKLHIWEKPESKKEIEYQQLTRWSDELQDYEYYDTDIAIAEHYVEANYTVGLDTSGSGTDPNRLVVWHNIKDCMVAAFGKLHMSESEMARLCVEVAKYYNDALIAVETNYSHAVCDYIIEEGYDKMYIKESVTRIDKKNTTLEYGWNTNKSSKPTVIASIRRRVDEHPGCIPDKEFWYECEYYVKDDKGATNATSGHHDDIIMAAAIARYVSKSFQSKQTYSKRVKKKKDESINRGTIGLTIGGGMILPSPRKTNKLRKGVYNNNA